MTPGVHKNELFWTTQVPGSTFRVWNHGRRARLDIDCQPLTETFTFGGDLCISAQSSIRVDWKATGAFVDRGLGTDGNEAEFTRMSASFADARCTAKVRGTQTGAEWRTIGKLDSDGFYASVGDEKNGVFLT